MGIDFTLCAGEIDETPVHGEPPARYVERMAREKAAAVKTDFSANYILAADTTVSIHEKILGKPKDVDEAVDMLMMLSGNTHQVFSAICLACVDEDVEELVTVATDVTFMPFDHKLAAAYVNENESLDKAGGYGIQSKGCFLVERINGSYSNVVGLPLVEVVSLLTSYKVISPA